MAMPMCVNARFVYLQFMDAQLGGKKVYRSFVRRNFVSVFFPVFVTSVIYLDWARTQRFKKHQAEFEAAESIKINS
jgi:hypothetical protein